MGLEVLVGEEGKTGRRGILYYIGRTEDENNYLDV